MATLVLQVAGSVLGAAVGGPFGAMIGRSLGAIAGVVASAGAPLEGAVLDARSGTLLWRNAVKPALWEGALPPSGPSPYAMQRAIEELYQSMDNAVPAVLAPAAGRVLKVPLTIGTVIMAGEPVAQIAEENFVLRLRVPERHARFLKVGDTIRVDETELKQISGQEDAQTSPRFGKIKLVYPQIEEGRVVADAEVDGLGDYFVSERIRVWIAAGERKAFVIPERFIVTRFGVDYVRLHKEDGTTTDVPVQRGRAWPQPSLPDGIEILSGLHEGDRLVMP